MSDIEYSVITSDVIKSFDCIYLIVVAVSKKRCSKLPLSFLLLFMFHTNPAKKGCACYAAFNMLHARLCTCRTDYIDMNKPEKACLSY